MTHQTARWITSSYSGTQSSCVEVRSTYAGADVRDTKNRAAGHITVPIVAWSAFLDTATR